MKMNRWQFARRMSGWIPAVAACVAWVGAPLTAAQAPAASAAGQTAPAPSAEELETLVGPIALYPDDLVAIILPASTNPLQIVQVDRFLEKRKQDPKLPIDENWDEAVKNLANYPDVIKMMSNDLDWTSDLGEAVVADQGAVLSAIQAFRRKAQSAGNLKSDDKQKVEVEKEIIKIVPADPQVIYVPQYNPTTVVTYSTVPVYGYYPAPYPAYYYPYPPGAAFATGLIWGAAIGAAWGGAWGVGWGNNEININRNTNINTGDINRGDRGQGNRGQGNRGGQSAWKSDKKPGQVRTGGTRPTSASGARVGDRPGGAGAGSRPGGAAGGAGGGRPSTGAGGRDFGAGASASPRSSGGGASGGAFGGYGSGSAARADSSRGASSRSSMGGGSYGGGARAGGGSSGGGARAGGGGARGGGGGARGGGGRGGRR